MKSKLDIKYITKLFVHYLLFYCLLVFYYLDYISSYFSYTGFYVEFSLEKLILGLCLLIFLSLLFYGLEIHKPSTHLLNVLIFISVIPMLVLFALQNLDYIFILSLILSIVFVRFVLNIKIGKRIKIFVPDIAKKILILISIFLFIWLVLLDINYFNLNIMEVYEYRYVINEHTPKFLSYSYNIVFKGLIPILYLYFLFYEKSLSKKILYSILIFIVYVIIFGLTSHKFFLFLPVLLILLYIFVSKFTDISIILMILFILILLILYFVNNDIAFIAKSLLVRRLLFVPAQINFDYYHFFSQHSFIYFTDSKFLPFGYLLAYPYDLDVAHLIGREVYSKPEMSANTSWIGYGYAHLGIFGMLLYAGIIGIIFKYLDFLAKFLHYKFIIASFFPYMIVLFLSSDLKIVLFTHGLLFYMLFLNLLSYYKYRI